MAGETEKRKKADRRGKRRAEKKIEVEGENTKDGRRSRGVKEEERESGREDGRKQYGEKEDRDECRH